MAQEIVSALPKFDPFTGERLSAPRLEVTDQHAAKVTVVGGCPVPVTAYTIEQLLLDQNRMLARILKSRDLLDHTDFMGYLA